MARVAQLTGAQASSLAAPGFQTSSKASGTLALQSWPLRSAGAPPNLRTLLDTHGCFWLNAEQLSTNFKFHQKNRCLMSNEESC